MELGHNLILGGHLGSEKTCNKIIESLFWPGVHGDVTRFCRSYEVCQKTVPKGSVSKVPLEKPPLIDEPFQKVAIDTIGPITPMNENKSRFILTCVDYATKYPEAVALPSIETSRVAEALVGIFSRVGVPRQILSDNGSSFTSEMMSEVSRLLSIQNLYITLYHAQSNDLCEKYNGTLKPMFKRICADKPKTWHRYIEPLLFAYRKAPQASSKFSPFEFCMVGRFEVQ